MATTEILFAGFGGQGILSMGKFLAYTGMEEGKNVSWLPSYGPEMRGGTANCSVIVSDEEVGSPVVTEPDVLVVMNRPSLDKFEGSIKPGGILIMDSDMVDREPVRKDIRIIKVAAQARAEELGSRTAANMVLLGFLLVETGVVSAEDLLKVLWDHGKKSFYDINKRALELANCVEIQ
ncbi:MAG: 2-oxoacid:acceptor oxidoreductase family protein [Bacillota bacterium]|nr:2-oxoacid:acceptor oxidoreductase family protein [Bacillota bacterium]